MNDLKENQPTKKWNIWLPLLLAVVMVCGMLIGVKLQKAPVIKITSNDRIISPSNVAEPGRVEELIRYVESRYVDDVNRDQLIENAIFNVLGELDPHSNYISPKQLKEVNEQLEGNFEGVGIEFLIVEDTILVVAPIAGGPSESVGILAGDKIVQIEDSIVAGKNINTQGVIDRLKGKKDTDVKVTILRGTELHDFTITRDEIPINSVDIAYMLDEKTGYIKITRFSATTYKEFMAGLEQMVEKEGMEDLVIDLRQNPGGYLQEATNMLSQLFREKDRLLVYTKGRTVKRNDYKSTGKAFFEVGNIVVLIDEGAASASEILAGAIQDWDRGWVVGRRSFGKGLVQEQYNLSDGGALRLTVARYYTPSGRSIQKPYRGIDDYDEDVEERYHTGELTGNTTPIDSTDVAKHDTTTYHTNAGREVYGGGGISPDVFIPIDTLQFNNEYITLRKVAPQFAYRYVSNHGGINLFENLDIFRKEFHVNDDLLSDFVQYAIDNGAELDPARIKRPVQRKLKKLLKARIARHLFQEKGFYIIWNDDDDMVQKALELVDQELPLETAKKEAASLH